MQCIQLQRANTDIITIASILGIEKHPFTRSNTTYENLSATYSAWLSAQDIPTPILPSNRIAIRESPKISPQNKPAKPRASQQFADALKCRTPDAVFAMDEELSDIPAISLPPSVSQPSKASSPWRLSDSPSATRCVAHSRLG